MRSFFAMLVLVLLAGPLGAQTTESAPKKVAGFRLSDTAGKTWSLEDLKDRPAIVVVFLGTQCPINNAYVPRLAELHRQYAEWGVQFLAINANAQDSTEAVARHAQEFAIPFPVLRDEQQRVADRFGAERTPEAFVLDGQGVIRYRGRIDDQYGIGFQRPQPTRRDLALALDAVLADEPVAQPATEAAGCFIGRAPAPKSGCPVTFCKDISRIVQRHCQECHRPGQIGPMPLLSYDDVADWASMIREVVKNRRMPPWYADPGHGKFRNDRRLPDEDRAALLAWIDAGCPRGDERDLPAPRRFAEDWTIGTPDVVLTMAKEFTVPAKAPKNGIPYKYFLVPTDFTEDRWIQAVEARPGNRAVVHHILVYVVDGGKRLADIADGIGGGLLVAQAPGDLALVFPPGHAKRIPQGAKLALQVHYTANGTEQTDRSSVGLVFAKEPPRFEVKTRAIAQQLLFIPPGAADCTRSASSTFPRDVEVLSLFPHM
ncbi:MAG: redoxin domain-containing protein, partial [Caulobacteraceae bacterium]|nr:redoxin domain-containing protein [Caulobacteraceae bacterium]